jgi:hypothetical protein
MKRTGLCSECGFDWEGATGELARVLDSVAHEFGEVLAGCAESTLRARPSPSVWSPLEYAAHVRDVLAWYEERVRRVLSEERPHLSAGVGWAVVTEERAYHRESTDAVLGGLVGAAASLGGLLASLSSSEWLRVGVGSEGDERDVAILARRAVHEGVHHLVDVRRQTEGPAERSRWAPPA